MSNDGKDAAAATTAADIATTTAPSIPSSGQSDGGAAGAGSHTAPEKVSDPLYPVEFRVHVTMRYHRARRAWWTLLNRAASAAAALAGSTALIAVVGEGSIIAAGIAIVSGAFAALNAAIGFPDRIREHAELHRQFAEIASRIAASPDRDDATSRRFASEVLLIEGTEPPIIETLNVICHNQECEARGITDPCHKYKVYWVNRIFKSFGTVIDKFPSEDELAKRPKGIRAKLGRWWTG